MLASWPDDQKEKPILNEKAIETDAKKDGFFGVVTNVQDMSASEIVTNYKDLWKIEDAFGELKGALKARPVFHWTDHRIVWNSSLFITYLCEAHLTKQLRDKNLTLESPSINKKLIKPRPLTVAEAIRELKEVRAVPVKVRNPTIWTRTDIADNATKIFKAAGVEIPKKVLAATPNCSATS